MQRVFVTGYGDVSSLHPAGSAGGFFGALLDARAQAAPVGVRPLEGFSANGIIADKVARRMDRFTQIGYIAVHKALEHAGLDLESADRDRVGMILNTCYGPLDTTVGYLKKVLRQGPKTAPAAVFPNTVYNAFTGQITIALRIYGTNSTVSGHNPVAYGLDMIRQGYDDVMIVGGCEELAPAIVRGFQQWGYLPRDGEGGSGLVLGEGAAVLVLESEESVRRRGAAPLAEVGEYGLASASCGVNEVFPGDPECLAEAMRQALERSGARPGDVDLLVAAANGMAPLDRAEEEAVRSFFPAGRPATANARDALGETLGAASTFSTLLAVGAVAGDRLPAIDLAIVNSVELGGGTSSVVVRKCG
jgi:3-oxoacyl-[acyl-carrier-protein] synthase II